MLSSTVRRVTLATLCACACACGSAFAETLELKDVQDLSVQEVRRDTDVSLRVSGLAFHSALAVERVETTRRRDALIVKVLLARATKERSGSFEVRVDVPPDVRRVVFGREERQIWARGE